MSLTIAQGSILALHQDQLVKRGLADLESGQIKSLFFVAPNHIKFQEEVSLLKKIKDFNQQNAFLNIQVFSFSRLAWFYLKNSAFFGNQAISEVGMPLLIKKVLLENQEELVLLKSQVNAPGFIDQLQSLFTELQQGALTAGDLLEMSQLPSLKRVEAEKLTELFFLYEQYVKELPNFKLRETSLLQALSEFIATEDVSQTGFTFLGFQQFNPEERRVINSLMAGNATVVLDQVYDPQAPDFLNWLVSDVAQFQEVARELNISQWVQEVAEPENSAAQEVATFWRDSFQKMPEPQKIPAVDDFLHLIEGQSAYEEVLWVAKEIKRLVRSGVRYKDIGLYLRDFSLYQELIENIFAQNEIPMMFSQSLTMKQHPLVEFLESLFLVHEGNFRYQDVARLLKSELLYWDDDYGEIHGDEIIGGEDSVKFNQLNGMPLSHEEELSYWQENQQDFQRKVDLFENILLQNDFRGADFTKGPWHLLTVPQIDSGELKKDPRYLKEKELEDFSNTFKDQFVHCVHHFYQTLEKAQTGLEAAGIFYQFLEESGVKEQFSWFQKEAISNGNLALAKNHEQTWAALCQLLDEYVVIFGDEPFVYEDFRQLLATGLSELSYDQIPQTLDQVQIQQVENALPKNKAYVFGLGLDQEAMPKKIANNTLLTDEERQKIATVQDFHSLSFDTEKENQRENLYMLHLLSAGTAGVYLSYARQKEKGLMAPSSFITRLKQHFQLNWQEAMSLKKVEDDAQTIGRLSTYRQLLTDYASVFAVNRQKETVLHPFWQSVPSLLRKSSEAPLYQKLEQAWPQKNIPKNMTPETATDLYGENIQASVSKMENFYDCQYKYYLTYGLKLKERELFGLNPQITGEFFHEVLDELFKIIMHNGQLLANLTDEKLKVFLTETLDLVLSERHYQVFARSQRMIYLKDNLISTLKNMVKAIHWQMGQMTSQTVATEWFFDGQSHHSQNLTGPNFLLSNGQHLYLRGIIDRVDITALDQSSYITVVDYKSSKHNFSFADAYYGLAMQMLTYLDVVLMPENKEKLSGKLASLDSDNFKAGGAFYLHVRNPELKPEKATEKDWYKEFKYQGLLVKDDDFLNEIEPDAQGHSIILPLQKLKSGELKTSESQSVSESELDLLRARNRENLVTAGNDLVSGKIELNPSYHDKKRRACNYCPFRSICRFDVLTPENNYRKIEPLSKGDVLGKIAPKNEENATENGEVRP
ncbi:PD-(D/E)XK nuclease family protein [Enterococcus timonensis]|uniref:PD-(D/E)XK nuclease family protein n=1 Tax=Enterococcus timonensis TaxID=1852364 RepID=UPI0008D9CD8C|nr:PD-(D/E)XK nuclease family protein [Enterococcus timonensis]